MTQPAKVQEPSMEEILASIRRIIADDEAKPATAEKPSAPSAPAAPARPEKPVPPPAAKAPASDPVPPAPAAPKAVVAPPPPPPSRAAPAPAPGPAETNSQDDIDALLNGLDEATTPEEIRPASSDIEVLELTDEMALPDPPRPAFKRVEPTDDLEFTEAGRVAPRPSLFETPAVESPVASQQILSRSTVSAVESAFNSLAHTVLSQNARTLEDLVKEMLRPMLKSWLDDNLPGLVERIVKAEIERVSRGR
jgi:cell pole-organizing protein PopZ